LPGKKSAFSGAQRSFKYHFAEIVKFGRAPVISMFVRIEEEIPDLLFGEFRHL